MERHAPTAHLASQPTLLQPLSDRDPGGASNLPASLTSLIGRELEITAVCKLLQRDNARLLTFTGPGGVGKTQLALAVARGLSHDFAEGAVFVSLAPLNDPALVASAIAQAVEVRDSGTRSLFDTLRDALRDRELLLVLDNFEHVTPAAPLVVDLLTACPRLKVLVTSRELLHLSGEHAFEVLPLDLPPATQSLPIDELASCGAIQLFVTRTREVKSDFALTDGNADAVVEICQRLDGLPLAIELAAARVRVLSPQALLSQMINSLSLLTEGHRNAPERLQTMRQAIAWSYNLLTAAEQRLYRQLSVFVGGFSLEAAQAVMADETVLDVLTSLVDKSLVRPVGQRDGEPRFAMLETIREFGLEQLEASGESKAVRDAHAAAFVALAEAALPHYDDDRWLEWMDKVEADLANCHAALEWADINSDAETVARLAGALWRLETARGYPSDSGRWLERALTMRDDVSPAALTEVLEGAACFYTFLDDDSARAHALSSELLAHADALGDAYGACDAHFYLADLAIRRSDYAEATAHYRQALALAPLARNPATVITRPIFGLACIAFLQGDLTAAATGFADVLARSREIGYLFGIRIALAQLGRVRLAQGNIKDAAALMAEGLGLAWDTRETLGIADGLAGLAAAAVAMGQVREAAHLLGALDALRLRYGVLHDLRASAETAQAEVDARRAMGDEAFTAAHAAGQKMSLEEATQAAYAVAGIARAGSPLPASTTGHGLTPREVQVLKLAAAGRSDREIAEKLYISPRTASEHVSHILKKLDVATRAEAAAWAVRNGLA